MGKNVEHYSIDKIKSLNADINLIYGERSNGKSYQVKHVIALDTFMNSYNKLSKESLLTESVNELKRFFLLRRFEVEIKQGAAAAKTSLPRSLSNIGKIIISLSIKNSA